METKNPIALRSKSWLTAALFEIMQTKPFKEISITEITDKADLSRRTFYRFFTSKEDVIMNYLIEMWNTNSPQLFNSCDHSYYAIVKWLFKFWYEQRSFLQLMYKNDLFYILQNYYNKIAPTIYKERRKDFPTGPNSEALGYVLAYSAGGLLHVLWKWVSEGMQKSPDEIMDFLMSAYIKPLT